MREKFDDTLTKVFITTFTVLRSIGSKFAAIPTIWWTIIYIIMIVCTRLNLPVLCTTAQLTKVFVNWSVIIRFDFLA